MDWSRFNKKPVRLGVHTGGQRLREHRPPARMAEVQAQASEAELHDANNCKSIASRVAELEAKGVTPESPAQAPAAGDKTRALGSDAYEAAPKASAVIEAPPSVGAVTSTEGSEAVKALSNLEMQIERGAAVKELEKYKGLTKSERRAKRAKAEKAASEAAVGHLLVTYEKKLKDKGTITPENLAEHILARNIHKRRDNWYRETADRNWYRNYVHQNDLVFHDDIKYFDRKADDAAADRRRADLEADRARSSSYDTRRSSYEYDSWKRDMDRRLDDADYWRNRGYRD